METAIVVPGERIGASQKREQREETTEGVAGQNMRQLPSRQLPLDGDSHFFRECVQKCGGTAELERGHRDIPDRPAPWA
jgi:hypothetical protein